MKKITVTIMLLVVALFVLPFVGKLSQKPEQVPDNTSSDTSEVMSINVPDSGYTVTVKMNSGEVQEMDLNRYLWGVVAAEMPASFEQEALDAQAIAARTYTLYKVGKSKNHPEADICTNYSCCQAWISVDDAANNWASDATHYADKISKAVSDTNNQVILYNGKLIDAVFHSSSFENTVDSIEVWGNDVPYLRSVSTLETAETVSNLFSTVTFTADEFQAKAKECWPEADLSGIPETWFGQPELAEGGSVHAIMIGGISVSGNNVRNKLSLKSPRFTVSVENGNIVFNVAGYGHGVGMSQYGAHLMAKNGTDYKEILKHYYTGVEVEIYQGN